MHIQRPLSRKRLVSLTPLIDVVFILLLFFMLASSFIEWRSIGLNVPAGGSAGSSDQESLVIGVSRDGKLRLNGEAVTWEGLEARIRPVLARDAAQPFVVQPEAEVPLQRIVTVLDRLAAVGARNISLTREGR